MRITFHEILVISPFLSGGVIRDFNDRNTRSLINDARYMLITREMSLGRLKPEDVSHFQIYKIKDNELHIDFESDAARDADYTFSVKNGVLTMTGGEGSTEPGRVYELTRQE